MEKDNAFFQMVVILRKVQKAYFNKRMPEALQASIAEEMKVDELLKKTKAYTSTDIDCVIDKELYQFHELVKNMRHNQKRYFKFQRSEIMRTAKELESMVDKIIDEKTNPQLGLWS